MWTREQYNIILDTIFWWKDKLSKQGSDEAVIEEVAKLLGREIKRNGETDTSEECSIILSKDDDKVISSIVAHELRDSKETRSLKQLVTQIRDRRYFEFHATTIASSDITVQGVRAMVVLDAKIKLGRTKEDPNFAPLKTLYSEGRPLKVTSTEIILQPRIAKFDERGRPHSENNFAIEWPGGRKQWFWHGIELDQKIIETPEIVTLEEILDEGNIERQRTLIEKIGPDRLAGMLKLKEIQRDEFGVLMEGEIKRNERRVEPWSRSRSAWGSLPDHWDTIGQVDTRLGAFTGFDRTNATTIRFVKVKDASSDREYYIEVPPETKTAKEGVAWSFEMKASDYKPEVET